MGTRPIIYKYPLDLTGHNPNNLVLGEPQVLPQGENRAVVPNYGAFFAESLRVREVETGRLLVPREDFKAVQLYQEATQKTGQEVCAALVVTNPAISKNIEIDYQAIGGQFSYSVIGLRKMLEDLDIDNRPVRWGDMLGRPSDFPPAPHLHDAGDLYGFEYLVEAIDALRHAIMVGQEGSLAELRQYIELIEEDTRDQISTFFKNTTDELNDFKDQITDFERDVENRVKTFEEDVESRVKVMEDRTSRGSLREFFAEWMDEEYLRTHSFDPQAHRITKYDVGLGRIKDDPMATTGLIRGHLMPHLDLLHQKWLKTHTLTVNEDHQVTAAQVGLGHLDGVTLYTVASADADVERYSKL